MQLEKKKYKKSDVEKLLTEQSFAYEKEILTLKKQNVKLLEKVYELKKEIATVKKPPNSGACKKDEPFNPKKKIAEYIKGGAENGFDLNEVHNIDDSALGEICRELGLTDDQ